MRNIDKLFSIEKACGLFELKAEGKFPLWDIVRYDVYQQITAYNNEISKKGRKSKISFRIIANSLKSLLNVPKEFKENLFFINSRNRRKGGLYFDRTSKQCIDSFPEDSVSIIETAPPRRHFVDYPKHSILEYFFRLFHFPKYKIDEVTEILLRDIVDVINNEIGEELIDYAVLCRSYSHFRQEYLAYDKIFKKGKVQRVFFVQNGIHKGLLLAAKENNVSTYELQHGIVGKDNELYSYSNELEYKESSVINPDTFFTLGAYWNNTFWHPFMKTVALGNDYFTKERCLKHGGALTILSSQIYENTIRPLAIEIAKQYKNLNIYYKLHPNQFSTSSTIQDAFAACPNVTVVCDECSWEQLMEQSNTILGIASSVIYEALQAGLNAIIFKRMNYEWHEDLFSCEDVFLIDGIEDYKKLEADVQFNKNSESKTEKLFFERFKEEVLLRNIN